MSVRALRLAIPEGAATAPAGVADFADAGDWARAARAALAFAAGNGMINIDQGTARSIVHENKAEAAMMLYNMLYYEE